jgi:acetyl esterase/lipase
LLRRAKKIYICQRMLFMKKGLLFFIHAIFFLMGFSQTVLPLYSGAIPNSRPVKNEEKSEITTDTHVLVISHISKPELSIFLPAADKANGTAVVICPGGGYGVVAAGHEGSDVAKKLNEMGIAAFVLKYRIPTDESMVDKEIGPLQDAQRAIQLVRQNAKKWHVDPTRVGIMGFSAGGHLAATAGTHFKKSMIENIGNINLRPDFMVLIYPVISFTDSIGHIGSRDNLLGKNPTAEKIVEYSNELQVTEKTPPAFLVHAGDDDEVKVQNALYFYEALQRNNIPAELHIYPKGGHGFGMNNSTTKDKWMNLLKYWLQSNGWLKKSMHDK